MNTNGVTWTKEDVQLVEKFIELKNKGFYVDGGQLTSTYNRILHKNVNVTNCGSCLRQRITELEASLNRFKSMNEKVMENEVVRDPSQEMKDRMAKVRAAIGKKSKK